MIVKADRGDGSFHLFPEVKDIVYTSPETVFKCIQKETLDEYFENMAFSQKGDGLTFYKVNPDKYPSERRDLFFGRRREHEQFCVKRLVFIQDDIEYAIYTEYPVYLCNESGKTIEVIK